MPKLSPAREAVALLVGLTLLSRGKVRDTYLLPCGKLLQVATDAISIFDFILNAMIPWKGIILTAMSVFWFLLLKKFGIRTHLVAYGSGIDKYLPKHLRGNVDLQCRALVVEKLDMVKKYEFIPRAVLTGSAVEPYKRTGKIFGERLPEGLQDGDELPSPMDTATTKAVVGHDEHVSAAAVRAEYPEVVYLAMKIFAIAQAVARKCGIFIADTKFEFGRKKVNGKYVWVLGDEALTPDSSRFWSLVEWLLSRIPIIGRKAPAGFDKEPTRAWGKTLGINDGKKFNPKKPADVVKVHAIPVPAAVTKATTERYRYIFWRLTGMTIETYLRVIMKVNIPEPAAKNVLLLFGSDSDITPEVKAVLADPARKAKVTAHAMSCHRNLMELAGYIALVGRRFDLIAGYGSMAFAQPGIVDALVASFKMETRVAGVACGEPGSEKLLAAQLSISQLPGQPVVMDDISGKVYTGPEGLKTLLDRVDNGELPPAKARKEKPVQWNVLDN
jgi:phosphoribosylaminoimidazole-succinocarboxamide synthase